MGSYFSKSYYHTDPSTFATKIPDNEAEETPDWKEYDYIVVGGGMFSDLISAINPYLTIPLSLGSAGCVVASRLSEDPKVSVLLIESGKRSV